MLPTADPHAQTRFHLSAVAHSTDAVRESGPRNDVAHKNMSFGRLFSRANFETGIFVPMSTTWNLWHFGSQKCLTIYLTDRAELYPRSSLTQEHRPFGHWSPGIAYLKLKQLSDEAAASGLTKTAACVKRWALLDAMAAREQSYCPKVIHLEGLVAGVGVGEAVPDFGRTGEIER